MNSSNYTYDNNYYQGISHDNYFASPKMPSKDHEVALMKTSFGSSKFGASGTKSVIFAYNLEF